MSKKQENKDKDIKDKNKTDSELSESMNKKVKEEVDKNVDKQTIDSKIKNMPDKLQFDKTGRMINQNVDSDDKQEEKNTQEKDEKESKDKSVLEKHNDDKIKKDMKLNISMNISKSKDMDQDARPDLNKSTDKDAIGAQNTKAQATKNLAMNASSYAQQVLAQDIQSQTSNIPKPTDESFLTDLSLEDGPWLPTFSGGTIVVNKPPRLLRIEGVNVSSIPSYDSYYDDKLCLKNLPLIQESRDVFAKGTEIVKVVLKSENTIYNISHDPNQQISTDDTLFTNVLLASDADTSPPYTTTSKQNIQHVFTYIFKMLPLIVKSCRVCWQLDKELIDMLPYSCIEENSSTDNVLLAHIGTQKLPEGFGIHIIHGALYHPIRWFRNDVEKMFLKNPDEYRMGRIAEVKRMRGGRLKELDVNVAVDQTAAALYEIHRQRRVSTTMSIVQLCRHLRRLTIKGTIIRPPTNYREEDYEIPALTSVDADSFIFMFLVSKKFQNGVITMLVDHLNNMDLLESGSIADALRKVRSSRINSVSEELIGNILSASVVVGTRDFIEMIVYDVMASFIPVQYVERAVEFDDVFSIHYFLMDLVSLVLFPNIVRQNRHRIGYNICNFLRNIKNKEFLDFHRKNGFCQNSKHIAPIEDLHYWNGVIPFIFDNSKNVSPNNIVGMIRSLLEVEGEEYQQEEDGGLNIPRLEDEPTGWIPYKRIRREQGKRDNPMYSKFETIIDIVKKAGVSLNTTFQERTQIRSEFLKFIASLDILFKEFCAALHFEVNYLYNFAMDWFGTIWTDVKGPKDYANTQILRLAVTGDENMKFQPWSINRSPIRVTPAICMSFVLSVRGVYNTYSTPRPKETKINLGNPLKLFAQQYNIMKACSQNTEVFAIARKVLSNDGEFILKEIHELAQRSSETVVYLNVIQMLASQITTMPSDINDYIEQNIHRINKMKYWNPKVVFVNHLDDIVKKNDKPSIMNRRLKFGDRWLDLEIEEACALLFSKDSFLFPIVRGIVISKRKVTFLDPNLDPPFIKALRIRITDDQTRLFNIEVIEGEPVRVFEYIDPDTNEITTIREITPGRMEKHIHIIARHPICIHQEDRRIIFELIKIGEMSFTFECLWYQANVDYDTEIPEDYPNSQLERIFNTFDDTLPLIIFPDTSSKFARPLDINDLRPRDITYQYLFPMKKLKRDILLRGIRGARPDPNVATAIDEENWESGLLGPSMKPLTGSGEPKNRLGKPNMLNTLRAEKKNSVNRELPTNIEIIVPKMLIGS